RGCPPLTDDQELHPRPVTHRPAWATPTPLRPAPPASNRRRVSTPSSHGRDPPGCAASPPPPRRRNAPDSSSSVVHHRPDGARLHAPERLVGAYGPALRSPSCAPPACGA